MADGRLLLKQSVQVSHLQTCHRINRSNNNLVDGWKDLYGAGRSGRSMQDKWRKAGHCTERDETSTVWVEKTEHARQVEENGAL